MKHAKLLNKQVAITIDITTEEGGEVRIHKSIEDAEYYARYDAPTDDVSQILIVAGDIYQLEPIIKEEELCTKL